MWKSKLKPFSPVEVSLQLKPYLRRDLLASHAKRIESAGASGKMPQEESEALSAVVKLTLAERNTLAEASLLALPPGT